MDGARAATGRPPQRARARMHARVKKSKDSSAASPSDWPGGLPGGAGTSCHLGAVISLTTSALQAGRGGAAIGSHERASEYRASAASALACVCCAAGMVSRARCAWGMLHHGVVAGPTRTYGTVAPCGAVIILYMNASAAASAWMGAVRGSCPAPARPPFPPTTARVPTPHPRGVTTAGHSRLCPAGEPLHHRPCAPSSTTLPQFWR